MGAPKTCGFTATGATIDSILRGAAASPEGQGLQNRASRVDRIGGALLLATALLLRSQGQCPQLSLSLIRQVKGPHL